MYVGCVDSVSRGHVSGWVLSALIHKPILVTLTIDGISISSQLADLPRVDVPEALTVNFCCGFNFEIPDDYCDAKPHRFEVFVAGTDFKIAHIDQQNSFYVEISDSRPLALDRSTVARLTSDMKIMVGDRWNAAGPLVFYACFNEAGALTISQRLMLERLIEIDCRIIIINASLKSTDAFFEAVRPFCVQLIARTNFGRDFASWLIGVHQFQNLTQNDRFVVFVNDSMLGPYGSLVDIINDYEKNPVDFYALTESWQNKYHLQSSLFILSRQCFFGPFQMFCRDYPFPNRKSDVIDFGEIDLSQKLLAAGSSYRVRAPYASLTKYWISRLEENILFIQNSPESKFGQPIFNQSSGQINYSRGQADYALGWYINVASNVRERIPLNSQHFFWRELLIDFKIPLIKKELLFQNPENIPDIWKIGDVVSNVFGPRSALPIYREFSGVNINRAPPIGLLDS